MSILSTLKRVFLDSEESIDSTSNMENVDLSDELKKSLKNIDNITSIEEARQMSAVNYGGKSKSSVKETSKVARVKRSSKTSIRSKGLVDKDEKTNEDLER